MKLKLRDTSGDKMTFLKIYIPALDPKNPVATPESQLDLADEIVKQLKNGASFEELAKQHSRDAFAEQGGKQENVPRTDLAPGLPHSSWTRPRAPSSDHSWTPGTHDRQGVRKILRPHSPLSQVHDQIEQRVAKQKSAARYERWIKTLRAKAMISRKQ